MNKDLTSCHTERSEVSKSAQPGRNKMNKERIAVHISEALRAGLSPNEVLETIKSLLNKITVPNKDKEFKQWKKHCR